MSYVNDGFGLLKKEGKMRRHFNSHTRAVHALTVK
jgi:hypothetical protein